MPDRRDIERRLSAARAEARQADAAVQAAARQASSDTLNRLLHLSLDERFAALEQADLKLTPADRRTLVSSLQTRAAGKRSVTAKTASRWAIWRARLRYNVASLMVVGASVVIAGCLFLAARQSTPEQWVMSAYPQDILATWRFANGGFAGDQLQAQRRYLLYRRKGDQGVLRQWAPAMGYAETRVPLNWLRSSK